MHAMTLDTLALGKRFGSFQALSDATLQIRPGTVHALLGENGAGKSTLVKCLSGYYTADSGSILIDGREQTITAPAQARALGIGMVYQHFTVVPGMTVAENLLLARGALPPVIHWAGVRRALTNFMATTPFRLDLDARPVELSAGEKQKLEILKQLLLQPRLLILDEPTSVLTPQEADEVLGALRERAHAGMCSVLLITHKFREVTAFADDVTVLRRGCQVFSGRATDSTPAALAEAMMGVARSLPAPPQRLLQPPGPERLHVSQLQVNGDRGEPAVRGLTLSVHAGEIVGVAGVSGNGQRELMQALTGQRQHVGGSVQVDQQPFHGWRHENQRLCVRSLPEEPLLNACVGALSVADNMALRDFEQAPLAWHGWIHWSRIRARAREWIARHGIKTQGERAPISSLSGGNVQRVVLAREVSVSARLLLVSNPVFGLDFAAVSDVHRRLMEARNAGCAVLMVSEDLDELLSLADRIVVISAGQIVFETMAANADRNLLGRHMGGHDQPTELAA